MSFERADQYLTLTAAAERLGIAYHTLRAWVVQGKHNLRGVQIGTQRFVERRGVEKLAGKLARQVAHE